MMFRYAEELEFKIKINIRVSPQRKLEVHSSVADLGGAGGACTLLGKTREDS